MKRVWWLLGWIVIRHWVRLACRLSWQTWYGAIKRWCWSTPKPLVKCWFRYRLFTLLDKGRCWHCPHCAYERFTDHDDLFVLTDSGRSYFGGHWFKGLQTCARCGTTHEYGDSSD